MKIHIVQKGDTLWKIAQKYGVNFEELKQANTQLSNPDMTMPGMKIKVPTGNVHVKKEAQIGGVKKEAQINLAPQKETKVEHPFADLSPEPFPVMEEELPEVKEEVAGVETGPYIPQMPQMPQMQPFEIDINNYNLMNMTMPQMPQMPQPPTNVLPGMMAPEVDDTDIAPAVDEIPEMPEMPQAGPGFQPPMPMYDNYCVPISPVMPGYGFNYVPGGPQGGFSGYPTQGFPRVESPGMVAGVEDIDLPPEMPTAPTPEFQQPQQIAPIGMAPMPQMPPMQAPFIGNCVPYTPVMPGYGFNGFPPAQFAPGNPMNGPMPQMPNAVSPGMNDVNQIPYMGNPVGPMPGHMNPQAQAFLPSQHYKKNDCGCGGPGPKVQPGFGGYPQQFYGGQPMQQVPFQAPPMGYPGGYQQSPFGVNPNQQMQYNPMFAMPDFDDDFED